MSFNIREEDLIIKPYKSDNQIHIRQQKGKYQRIRQYTGTVLMLIFIALPWLSYHQQQAILLDIEAQQFRIFGLTFFPQDLTILAWLFMASAFALFFITTWLGRIWCGFLCPQTVWMFMYVWVEEKIEGSRNQRIKLANGEKNRQYYLKKTTKHAAWLVIAFLTSTTFMSYFVPVKILYTELFNLQWSGLVWFWVGLFTLCTYGNAGWLREKMCIYMCPYSRFQSAMFDDNTMLVAYDEKRGENRGRRKRKDDHKAMNLGDCVDCNLCVEVCPAGIDIRNGLQYECISCGACIDACDQTMSKFNYAKGLISFTSEKRLQGQQQKTLRPKVLSYGSFTLLAFLLMALMIHLRVPVEASIIRDRHALYRTNFDGSVENTYQLKITNKSQLRQSYQLEVVGITHAKLSVPPIFTIDGQEMIVVPLTITTAPEYLNQRMQPITFKITALAQDDVSLEKSSYFYSG
ncbi:cytochrome c oxidase accessory protein CcoG [Thalassotalea fusca]